tara:strand:+ start:96719 stop:99076 length:2358 start_codon:yes stop_codon:yes gene_type:complete
MSNTAIKGRDKTRKERSSSRRGSFVPVKIMMKLVGLVLLLVTFNVFRDFPGFGFWLIATGMLYLIALFFLPYLWLAILPVVTVSLDLATYTGRFLFNEFDLVFLITIGFGLLSGKFSLGFLRPSWAMLLVGSYLAVVLSGFSAWEVFLSPPGAIDGNPYYLPEYGYRVIKGMLWAFLLVPIWIHLQKEDQDKAINWLVVGLCAAALLLGLVILWERGTLGVILSGSAWYHTASSLFDLSSSYRTTGIFSDMHTGGEVIDGVILLLLPMALYGIFQGSNNVIRALALLAFGSLAYCTTVGFTRATYVSFFMGIAAFLVLYVIAHRRSGTLKGGHPYWLFGSTILAAFCAAYVAFSYAGSLGVASFVGLVLAAYLGGQLFRRNTWMAIGFWVIAGGIFLAIAVNAHFSSRWVDRSSEAALIVSSLLLFFYLLVGFLFVKLRHQTEFNKLLWVALLVMLPAGFSMAFGGYKFNERMENVSKDMGSRMIHWQNVIDSSGDDLKQSLLGNGPGTFPANYVYRFPEAVSDIGSYVVHQEGYDAYLSMGPGEDLAFGQRVSIQSNTTYDLVLKIRAEQPGRVAFFLCERNLIFASNFMANCKVSAVKFNATSGEFIEVSTTLDSGKVGARHWLNRWPTTLYLKNFSKAGVVDIKEIYFGHQGEQLLENSQFSRGTDSWFFYNDFAHLPWHIKNTYLQSWYHFGWLGFVLFLVLGIATVVSAIRIQERGSMINMAFATGIIAIAVFGVFGSPLDSPRVSWLFYFYIFASLLKSKSDVSRRVGVRRSRDISVED